MTEVLNAVHMSGYAAIHLGSRLGRRQQRPHTATAVMRETQPGAARPETDSRRKPDRHATPGGVYARPSPELRKQIKPALQGHDWTVNDVLVACLTRLVKDPAGTLEWLAGDKPPPKKGRPSKQG